MLAWDIFRHCPISCWTCAKCVPLMFSLHFLLQCDIHTEKCTNHKGRALSVFPKWTHPCKQLPEQERKGYPHHPQSSPQAPFQSVASFQVCFARMTFCKSFCSVLLNPWPLLLNWKSHALCNPRSSYTTSQEDLSFVFHDVYYENHRFFTLKTIV